EDSYSYSTSLQNQVFLGFSGQGCIAEVVVGGNERKVGFVEMFENTVNAIVKFVVAEGACIISQLGHEGKLQLSIKKVEIGGTLKHISCIEQKYMLFFLTYFVRS